MPRQEFVRLMEENVLTLNRLGEQLKIEPGVISDYPRQQLTTLVRLNIGCRAKLKDIARREGITPPHLCATFRKLEKDCLVERTIDENDRRNTWYSVTPRGKEIASRVMEKFREGIEKLFSDIESEDEKRLTAAMKTMNEILTKMEIKNA